MSDYDKNWIEFFRNSAVSDVDIDALEAVHTHLAGAYSNNVISPKVLYRQVGNNFEIYRKVLIGLSQSKIIEYRPKCPSCGNPLPEANDNFRNHTCDACGQEYDNIELENSILLLAHSGKLSELLETSYELNALILSKQAMQRGYIYYLCCDIEGSELLQKKSTPTYNVIIRKLWGAFWPKALLECRKVYLPLMARGDACIVAFFDLADGLSVITALKDYLQSEPFKLSVHYDELEYTTNDAGGFVRSLDNRWDFNSPNVTIFHRRAHGIKPQAWNPNQSYTLKLCFLDGMLKHRDSLESKLETKLSLESYSFDSKHVEEGKYVGQLLACVL